MPQALSLLTCRSIIYQQSIVELKNQSILSFHSNQTFMAKKELRRRRRRSSIPSTKQRKSGNAVKFSGSK